MKVVSQYLARNQEKVKELFQNNSKDEQIPATKVFVFLQQAFQIQSLSISKDAKEFFKDDNNEPYIEQVIEKYYKTTPDGQHTKFYLYRINFDYSQVLSFLEYWLSTDTSITVRDSFNSESHPKADVPHQLHNSIFQDKQTEQVNLPHELRQSALQDNQFIVEEEKKPMLIAAYQAQIKKMQEMLLRVPQNQQESAQIQEKIRLIKQKIVILSKDQHHIHEPAGKKHISKEHSSLSPKKSKTEGKDKKFNFKALFEYYAKQNHLTGAKSSFEHIQHSTQTINYQKLVFFLKEYDLFPSKTRDQKRIYNLYVRTCSNTRDLFYNDFMAFLERLPQIVINEAEGSSQTKKEAMMSKIQSKSEKNKLLHNPFHSAQKQNFRIDQNDIKYEFKLKPINGKLETEVNVELENRRRQKQQNKIQLQREKKKKQILRLKRIMAVDPYHPMIVKNGHLLKEKSYSVMQQPIVNLDNIQKIRDSSFDMKAKFGISDFEEDPLKAMMSNRYDIDKRVEMMEREESLKMSNLMSGIIQRSQAKLAKLGLSPRKKNKFAM